MKKYLVLFCLAGCQPISASIDMHEMGVSHDAGTQVPSRLKPRTYSGTTLALGVSVLQTAVPVFNTNVAPLYDTQLKTPCMLWQYTSAPVAIENTYAYYTAIGPTFFKVDGLIRMSGQTYAKASTCNLIGTYNHYTADIVPMSTS